MKHGTSAVLARSCGVFYASMSGKRDTQQSERLRPEMSCRVCLREALVDCGPDFALYI